MTAPALRRRSPVLLSGMAVVLLVAVVLLGIKLHQNKSDSAHVDARNEAVAAARQTIINLDGLSAAKIDADLALVLEGATGKFKTQFENAKGDLKTLVVQRKTVSSGKIVAAAVVTSSSSKATILVAVDRTVTDTTSPNGSTSNDRWVLTLEKLGSRWLVSDLEPVA